MARDYARIMTAIWNNPKFVALSEPEQRAYLLLITQPDISAAGVLRMWVPRWAEMSSTSTTDDFTRALKGLESRHFIVLDLTFGELFIRSFIKWDAGYNNTKRKPVIRRAREEVRSSRIREYLDADFVRFGLDDPPPGGGIAGTADSPSTSTGGHVDRAPDSPSVTIEPDPTETPSEHVDALSDGPSTSDGVVVAYPQSAVPTPASAADAAEGADDCGQTALLPPGEAPPGRIAHKIAHAFAERHKPVNFHGVMALAKQAVNADFVPDDILAALERVASAGKPITADTLRNALLGTDPRAPAPARRSAADRAAEAADAAWDAIEARGATVHQLNTRSQGA